MLAYLLMVLLALTGIFLILLVLIQRGRGGGLAGAFGGMGGQSAFGTKAGDLFTRVTIGVAAFWIILCAVSVKLLSTPVSKFDASLGGSATAEDQPGTTVTKPSDKTPGDSKSSSAPTSTKSASSPAEAPEPRGPAGPTSNQRDAQK